ncbi:hypothetical protein BDY19DRAFT_321026 [Irpex rosettiformis]|uniref:Uncharacterized protein n=1 Tax=Irpex rosettiformis TaxID=378272 RepID=A0ACB8TYH0_9APHY|nr:hypothetical protein BDY19DRAFT_321026 [Irpex rosettiformis]
MKFHASTVDQCCCIMITDTKQVWGETITSNRLSRRWRECNPGIASPPSAAGEEEEDEWRSLTLDLLSAAHTIGGIASLAFEIVQSRNADLAFELRGEQFRWRWETYSLGPKTSAEVISKQLIMPLISVAHTAFTSAEPVSSQSEIDLEKSIDKVGRTARRTIPTHMRTAISKPRLASSLRRMTAIFNFSPDTPSVISEVQPPEFKLPVVTPKPLPAPPEPASPAAKSAAAPDSSATEYSTDDQRRNRGSPAQTSDNDQEPSSSRPSKKAKKVESSDSDSDSDDDTPEARKRRLARIKRNSLASTGVRQPAKRGGKRF